jgi:hypothetical protein
LNALVLVIIIIVDVSFGVIEKNRTLFIAPTLVLFSALYILLPKVIANSSGYEGTDVSIELVSIRTFLVQIFSALPLSTIPLAIYLYPGLLLFILLALVLLVRMQFFQSSVRPLDLPKLCEMSVRDKLLLAMLTSYALLSAGAFALSEKYQKEILWPGQTYMASPVIQFMFMLITFQFLWINMDKIRNFYGIAIVLLCLNFTFNTALVYNMHLKNFASSQLIEGLVGAEENKRCEYLQDWVLEGRPIYYKEWVIESLQGTHKIWFGEKYCGSQP